MATFKRRLYATKEWKRIRRLVFTRDGFTCQLCGKQGARFECDHIKPLIDGGLPLAMTNLRTACRSCHITLTKTQHEARQAQIRPRAAAFRRLVAELQRTTSP